MNYKRFINCKIYLENAKIIENGALEITDGKITKILDKYIKQDNDIDLKNNIIIPGLIDLQSNGGFGVSFLGVDDAGMKHYDAEIFKTGCTNYFATLITDIPERYENSIINIKNYLDKNPHSPCFGIHLEGPFLNIEKKGAHNGDYIIKGTIDKFKKYYDLSQGKVKQITFAPENTEIAVTKFAKEKNILICAGHSMAKYDDILLHQKHGLNSCTHLFNAMALFNHQFPNLIECFLNESSLYCQIIVDKFHVNPHVVEIAWKMKGAEKLALVTDSIVAMGLPNGEYKLGTLPVVSKDGRVSLKSNEKMLAGSALTMIKALQNFHDITKCSIHDLIKVTSTNPSKLLNVEDKLGTIAVNKIANIIVLNNKLELIHTIYHGEIVYSSNK